MYDSSVDLAVYRTMQQLTADAMCSCTVFSPAMWMVPQRAMPLNVHRLVCVSGDNIAQCQCA